jgi:hypothetical protein
VASGVNHIDTSDFYGPHITNQLIREALHPYPWPSGGAEATSIVEWHMRKASPSTS